MSGIKNEAARVRSVFVFTECWFFGIGLKELGGMKSETRSIHGFGVDVSSAGTRARRRFSEAAFQ
jgi:hypothetical protein